MTAKTRTKGGARINVRRKKFVKNLVAGMGVGAAAIRAGYANTNEGSTLLREKSVLTDLQRAMERAGLSDEYLAQKIREGLEASYPEKRAKDGSVLQAGAPDFFTRGQYLDKAFKVRGDYAPERSIQEQKTVVIQLSGHMTKGLIDCGVVTPEEVGVIDVGQDGYAGPERALPEGRASEGGAGAQEVREADGALGVHDPGGVPQEAERNQGPEAAGDGEGRAQGENVSISGPDSCEAL